MFSLELPASKCHPGPPHGYFHVKLNKQSIGTSHRTKSIHPLVGLRRYIATPENLPETADLKMVENLEISKRVQWTHLFGCSAPRPSLENPDTEAPPAWLGPLISKGFGTVGVRKFMDSNPSFDQLYKKKIKSLPTQVFILAIYSVCCAKLSHLSPFFFMTQVHSATNPQSTSLHWKMLQ